MARETLTDEARKPALRRRVFEALDQSSTESVSRIVDLTLIGLVVVNVMATILESVPRLSERYDALFSAVEIVSVAIFTLEYMARCWTAPEHALLGRLPPWRARIAFALRPSSLVDLVSIAPIYLSLLTEADFRSLLVLRLLRFFKLARYSPGLASLLDALAAERRALMACGVILFGTVLVAASAMRFAEQDMQPEKFGTIPDAMYWAFVTLATVGYGDVVPVTPLGKLIASLTAVVGIGMLALPVGILASTFADEIRRRDFVVTMTMVAKVPLFVDLDAGEVAGIMRYLNARTYEPGQTIVRKGDPADAMFFVNSGNVEVEVEPQPVQLGAGDVFGEMGLLAGRPRNATVNAISQARLLVLEARDLKHIMAHTPRMAERIQAIAEERQASAPDDAEDGDAS